MIIQFNNVCKTFGYKNLFKDVNFTINKENRIGLVGLNGSGKTTLIKIIHGQETPDKGSVSRASNIKIGCLYQEMYKNETRTLYELMLDAFKEVLDIKKRMQKLEADIDKDDDIRKKYGELQHEFEHSGGYDIDTEIEKVLNGLSFKQEDFNRKATTFSGGEKRRAGLAYLLLKKSDLLILDEPTNHLDLVSVKWLENFLVEYKGSILIISHDRYFIDKVVNRIFEIENKTLNIYSGDYEDYLLQKRERVELQQKQFEKQQEKIKRTEEFIRRNIAGQKTKQAQSRRKMLSKMERISPVHGEERKILIDKWKVDKSYNHVLSIKDVSKSFNGNFILDNVNLDIYRKEKIALVGANGTGKTTFLKLITDNVKPDSGNVELGKRVQPFYFSQNLESISGKQSVFDFIHAKIPMSTNGEVMKLLAWFYFRGEDVNNLLDNLSGGEKSRLLTLSLLLSEANFLLLDEPTNHLDIYTRESLAEALTYFPGTILFVSHDRHFIDEVADKVYVLHEGKITPIQGGFSENEDKILSLFKIDKGLAASSNKNKEEKQEQNNSQKTTRKNINVFMVEKLEKEIQELEKEIEALEQEKYKEENYTDGVKINEIQKSIEKLENNVMEKMQEWESYQ